ncbi:MAG: hypothetical protein SVV03_05460 [Candidatus Nanohaloarchaea archaeon]|nr:hypothetical protein [Candidatus Nanohaloarchaea archaeon]
MVIVDNNILSSLAKSDSLYLLEELFENVYTTPEVIHEYHNEHIIGYMFVGKILEPASYGTENNDKWLTIITPSVKENKQKQQLLGRQLSQADAECLAIAKSRNEKLLTDDTALGTKAEKEGVNVYDLETFLLSCVQQQLIDKEEAERILKEIEDKDYYTFSTGFKEKLYETLED